MTHRECLRSYTIISRYRRSTYLCKTGWLAVLLSRGSTVAPPLLAAPMLLFRRPSRASYLFYLHISLQSQDNGSLALHFHKQWKALLGHLKTPAECLGCLL